MRHDHARRSERSRRHFPRRRSIHSLSGDPVPGRAAVAAHMALELIGQHVLAVQPGGRGELRIHRERRRRINGGEVRDHFVQIDTETFEILNHILIG